MTSGTVQAAETKHEREKTLGRAFSIVTSDGATLGAFEHAAREPQAAVVVLGAMATPSRFYARFAEHLAQRGITTVRFDYRGVGASRDRALSEVRAGILDWTVRDVEAALAWVREHHRGLPLVIVGHSLGGQAIGIAQTAHEADAFVLIASQSGWVGHWPGLSRWRLELTWRVVVPSFTRAYGYLPGWAGLGEDVPSRVVREWAGWCTTPGYVTGALPKSDLHFAEVRGPLLAWSFSDDDYAPGRAVPELLSWLTNARIEHRALRPGDYGTGKRVGHFGFFRQGTEQLWDETASWILARVTRPS